MVFGLFRRRSDDRASRLYRQVVEAARHPVLYEAFGVPDTVDGRFEMVVLFGGLVVRRLSAPDGDRDLARALSETFFTDMDRTLREMGIGDLSVPKKMKKVASAFYGRLQAYSEAAEESGLAAALARNVYGDSAAPAAALARYVRTTEAALAAAAPLEIAAGRFAFPDPAGHLPKETDR